MSTTDRPIAGAGSTTSTSASPVAAGPETYGPETYESEITALIEEIGEEAVLLLRQELALARAELRESTSRATSAGAGIGVAAVAGALALAILAVAAGLALAEVLPPAVAFLVVGLALTAVAAVGWTIGRRNLRAIDPMPRRTIDTVKEDLSWLRTRMS